jgi:pimeloyl-ACP methyl ester carboxylesterase
MSRWGVGVLVCSLAVPPLAAEEKHVGVAPGERLHVIEIGRGAPVVLVPGLLGSAFGFRRLTEPLAAAGFRAIIVEPLGVGASGKPEPADYSLTAQADRIAVVLDELRAAGAVVVAHGVAGSIALRLAYRHPEQVGGIVLLDGGAAESAATPGFKRAMRFSFLIRLLGGMSRIRSGVRSTLVERSADPRWVTDEVVEGYMGAAARDLDGTLRAFRQIAKAQEPEPVAPHLALVRCPVRLVIGEATRTGGLNAADIDLLATRLPAFAVDRVPRAGYFVFEEEPAAVLRAIERARTAAASRTAAAADPPAGERP